MQNLDAFIQFFLCVHAFFLANSINSKKRLTGAYFLGEVCSKYAWFSVLCLFWIKNAYVHASTTQLTTRLLVSGDPGRVDQSRG